MTFRQLRYAKGYTMDDVASYVGVSKQAVWVWERGKSLPRADSIQKLAKLFGVSMQQMLGVFVHE